MQPVLLKFLYQAGRWNPDVVVSPVREQRFGLICMFEKSQFVHPVREAIHRHYVRTATVPMKTFRPESESALLVFERRRERAGEAVAADGGVEVKGGN
jgi:hypothetical protein